MEIIPEEAQSKGHKFGTQHLRNPLPSRHHQPNKLQQIQSYTRRNTTHKVHLVNGLVGLDYVNYLQDSKYLNSVSCIPPLFYLQVIKYTWSTGFKRHPLIFFCTSRRTFIDVLGVLSTGWAPSTIYATLTKPEILYTNPNKKHTKLPMMPLFSTTKIQHLRPPYPPDPNEYNPTQEETLRKKKAKNPPPIVFSSHFSFYFPL